MNSTTGSRSHSIRHPHCQRNATGRVQDDLGLEKEEEDPPRLPPLSSRRPTVSVASLVPLSLVLLLLFCVSVAEGGLELNVPDMKNGPPFFSKHFNSIP